MEQQKATFILTLHSDERRGLYFIQMGGMEMKMRFTFYHLADILEYPILFEHTNQNIEVFLLYLNVHFASFLLKSSYQ